MSKPREPSTDYKIRIILNVTVVTFQRLFIVYYLSSNTWVVTLGAGKIVGKGMAVMLSLLSSLPSSRTSKTL